MTLSRFVRDYVYIPLGGSRRGTFRTYFNLMFTMTLLGLWHGAAWTLVLWGTWNGIWMSIEHWSDGRIGRRFPAWVRWFVAFHLIVFGLVLFRSQNLELFGVYVEEFFKWGPPTLWTFPVVLATVLVVGVQLLPERPIRPRPGVDRAAPPGRAGGRARGRNPVRRGHGSEPGRAPVHLLSVLRMPSTHSDDSQMSRFDHPKVRRVGARQAVLAIAFTALLLVLFSGGSVETAADEIDPGIGRDIVAAVGDPTGWLADSLPFAEAQAELTGGLSPDSDLGEGGFAATPEAGAGAAATRVPPVGPESFDPTAIGEPPPPKLELEKLLVTGDSMSIPMDSVLAQRLAGDGVEVVRDAKLGSGISNSDFLDWGQVSSAQVRDEAPDAVVIIIGAGEGFPMDGPAGPVECCGPDWAAVYANRVRQMMDTYRQGGEARVYWLNIPASRNEKRWEISQVVNEAVRIAATPWLSQVRIVDLLSIFTPEGPTATRSRSTARRRSSATPTACTSTRPEPSSPPTPSSSASTRTSTAERTPRGGRAQRFIV